MTLSTGFVCLVIFFALANAQTWIGGSNSTDESGTYNNTLGSLNVIGARAEMACWEAGNQAFIFGGIGFGIHQLLEQQIGLLNDIWSFNYSNNVWKWVNGSNTVEAPSQYDPLLGPLTPGGRRNAVYWKSNDQLWLFGGLGIDAWFEEAVLNDVWAFNLITGLWSWKGGSQYGDQPPQYNATLPGPLNPAIPANPGSRDGAFSWLVRDESGEETLWLFGGMFEEEMMHDDVWTYNMTSNEWKWVAGSNLTGGGGQLNESAPGGLSPSARSSGASWVGPDGRLYLFGGFNVDPLFETISTLNDMWAFNRSSLRWSLVQPATANGTYNNTPDARPAPRYKALSTSDKQGNLWLFGGISGLSFEELADTLNDLWKYDVAANQWKWLQGSSTPNSQGVYNVTTRKGAPASRASGCLWIDSVERLLLFGGSNNTEEDFGYRNDLWVLIDDVFPPIPTTSTTASITTSSTTGQDSTTGGQTSTTGGQTSTSGGQTSGGSGSGGSGNTTTSTSANATTTSNYTLTTAGSSLTTGQTVTTGTISTITGTTSGAPNTTSGTSLTSGYSTLTTSTSISTSANATTGPHPPHSVNSGMIAGTVIGGSLAVGAGIVMILFWRGNLRLGNMFKRRDEDDVNELLPLTRKGKSGNSSLYPL